MREQNEKNTLGSEPLHVTGDAKTPGASRFFMISVTAGQLAYLHPGTKC